MARRRTLGLLNTWEAGSHAHRHSTRRLPRPARPVRAPARKPFFSFGHVWVVLALWVPLPWDRQRGVALPLLFRLYTSTKRGGRADAPARPTRGRRRAVADAVHAAHLAGARPTKL